MPVSARTITYRGRRVDLIVDVRSRVEWLMGHIDRAKCIPVERLAGRIGALDGITTDSTILVYCENGSRAKLAGDILRTLGYHKVIDGGPIARMRIEAKRGGQLRYDE